MTSLEELGGSLNATGTGGLGDLPTITTTISPQEECLKTRKWYCFLLSSIFTFLAGLFIILIWRAFAFLCCSRKRKAAAATKAAQAKAAAQANQDAAGQQTNANQRKAPKEGATEIGLMTEAKDWAGGLISGQTTTGRILVSMNVVCPYICMESGWIGRPWTRRFIQSWLRRVIGHVRRVLEYEIRQSLKVKQMFCLWNCGP